MIRIVLPAPLGALARLDGEVVLALEGAVTARALLDALEAAHPALRGTLRDPRTGERRPFVRFHAAGADLSFAAPDAPLPPAVVRGDEPFVIVGAMSGG